MVEGEGDAWQHHLLVWNFYGAVDLVLPVFDTLRWPYSR